MEASVFVGVEGGSGWWIPLRVVGKVGMRGDGEGGVEVIYGVWRVL